MLDRTTGLATGLVDGHGLLIESAQNDGSCPDEDTAAHLVGIHRYSVETLRRQVGGGWLQQVIVGTSEACYLQTIGEGYLLYLRVSRDRSPEKVGAALHEAKEHLEPLLAGYALLASAGQSLDESHQLTGADSSRKSDQSLLK